LFENQTVRSSRIHCTFQERQEVLVDIVNYTEKPERASKEEEIRVGNEEIAEQEAIKSKDLKEVASGSFSVEECVGDCTA
jgi:hypothetical protein